MRRGQRLSTWMRGIAALSHVALVAIMLARSGWSSSALLAVPLLLVAPGLIRGHRYSYQLASLLLVFYVAGYLSAGYAEPARKLALFSLASLAALDFVAVVLYVRFLGRERQAGIAG